MACPRILVREVQCTKQGCRAIFGIFGRTSPTLASSRTRWPKWWLYRLSRLNLRIWSQNYDVIIPWWRHNRFSTLFWPLMYRSTVNKFRYYNLLIGYRWCAFRICSRKCDVIIRWWRHDTLSTLFWPLMYRPSVKKSRYYNHYIGYRGYSFRISSQNCDVIIRWWLHKTLPTLFWPLMYMASVKKLRY